MVISAAEQLLNTVKYFEQSLSYNCGKLINASTVPLDPENSHFILREICNAFLVFSIAGIFLKRKRLACDVGSLEIGTTYVTKDSNR